MDANLCKKSRGLVIRQKPRSPKVSLHRHTTQAIDKFWINGYDWKYLCPGALNVQTAYNFVRRWPMWAINNITSIVARIRSRFISFSAGSRPRAAKVIRFVLATPYADTAMDIARDARRRTIDAVQRMYESLVVMAERQPQNNGRMSVAAGTNTEGTLYKGVRRARGACQNVVQAANNIVHIAAPQLTKSPPDQSTNPAEDAVDLQVQSNTTPVPTFEPRIETKYTKVRDARKWQEIPPLTMTLLRLYQKIGLLADYPQPMRHTLGWTTSEITEHLNETILDRLSFELEEDITEENVMELLNNIAEQNLKWPASAVSTQRAKILNIIYESFGQVNLREVPPWLTTFVNDMIDRIICRRPKPIGKTPAATPGQNDLVVSEHQRTVDKMNATICRTRYDVGFDAVRTVKETFRLITRYNDGQPQYYVSSSFEPGKLMTMTQALTRLATPPSSRWSRETLERYPNGVPL